MYYVKNAQGTAAKLTSQDWAGRLKTMTTSCPINMSLLAVGEFKESTK